MWVRRKACCMRGSHALATCQVQLDSARKMLDVGGGSGAFSYVFTDKHPNLTSLILELPEVRSQPLASRQGLGSAEWPTVHCSEPRDAVDSVRPSREPLL